MSCLCDVTSDDLQLDLLTAHETAVESARIAYLGKYGIDYRKDPEINTGVDRNAFWRKTYDDCTTSIILNPYQL